MPNLLPLETINFNSVDTTKAYDIEGHNNTLNALSFLCPSSNIPSDYGNFISMSRSQQLSDPSVSSSSETPKTNEFSEDSINLQPSQQESRKTKLEMENDNYLTGNIYNITDVSSNTYDLGIIRIKALALDCLNTSKSIRGAIKRELELEKKYLKTLKTRGAITFRAKVRKRRNPSCDVPTWQPMSVFTAFTDYKCNHFENTDYFDNIPSTSCFGRINMRVKRAWSRGPSKSKKS
ncbi:uncharacterized protein PRCAT00004667001 [Priceomyces carsonii]|uniref:uncharacterized protein n=1 Tax=Priceomyces carsonii TaxID=28549 RepID=UPI002EDBA2BE|nr:unnamed protein product [Priceomyces carsonii]